MRRDDPTLSGTVTGTENGETLAYTVKREAGEDVGTYGISIELTADAEVNKNYDIDATDTATFTINKKAATITVEDNSKIYGADDPTLSAIVTGTENGETLAYTVKREAGEDVGTYEISIEVDADADVNKNYTIDATDTATYTINKREVTVTGDSITIRQPYTGTEYKTTGYTFENVVKGETASISYELKGTEIGKYTGTFGDDFKVEANGVDVTGNYELTTKTPGTLEISNLADIKEFVTLTPNDVSVDYDGDEHATGTATATDKNGNAVKIEYSVDGTKWTTDPAEITALNVADSMTVKIRVTSEFYTGEVTGTQTLTINKSKTMTVTNIAELNYNGVYDGQKHGDVAEASDSADSKITYSTDGGETWSDKVPTINGAGKTEVTVRVENKNYEDYTGTYTLEVTPRKVSLTSADDSKVYDGTKLVNETVTVGEEGFVDGEGARYEVTGTQTNAGSSENTFGYTLKKGTEAGNYEITTAYGTLTVTKRPATLTADNKNKIYGDDEQTLTVTTENAAKGETLNYTVERITGENVGEYEIRVIPGDNPNYEVSTVSGIYTIEKKHVTLTADDMDKIYGEDDATLTATANGLVGDDTLDYTVEREAGENVGTYTIRAIPGNNPNYDVEPVDGTFTVNKSTDLAIVPEGAYEAIYDGKTHFTEGKANVTDGTVITYSTDGGRTWTDEVPTITDVGTVKVTVKAVNPNYEATTYDYTMTVTKRQVTLTSASESREYDATEMTNDNVTVGGDGFAEGEGATFMVTGKQTNAGESKNNFTYTLNDGTKAKNYDIVTTAGTLTVEKRSNVTVTVTGHTFEGEYTGVALAAEGYDISTNDTLYDLKSVRCRNEARIAKRNAGVYEMGLKPEDFTNTDDNFDVTFEVTDGSLMVNKKPATVTVVSQDKLYGEADPKLATRIEGLVEGDTLNYRVTRETGESSGIYRVQIETGENPNYEVSTVDGNFIVRKRQVTLTSASKEGRYNGDSLVDTTVKIGGDGFAKGEGVDVTVTGIQTGIGTSANTFTYSFREGTFEENYEITKIEGMLVVNEAETHTMKVRFVDADGNEMAASFEKQYTFGTYYEIKVPELTGFTPDKEVITGRMGPEDIEVTVSYTANTYKTVIRFVTADGNKVADDVILELGYGEQYRVEAPQVEGMNAVPAVVEGTMGAMDAEVTVMYTETRMIELINDYGTPLGVNNVSQPQGDCFE